jgi:hypothetical protein
MDYEFYGITQDLETKIYIMVLNKKCKECNYICNAIHFQQNFVNWTSDSDNIDEFIQDTQLSAHKTNEIPNALEWIPYDRFYGIKCIVEKKVYRATWIDGEISYWNSKNQNWMRKNQDMSVILKKLNNPKNITLEFMNEV